MTKPQPRPRDEGERESEGGDRQSAKPASDGKGAQPVRDLEPKTTIAVHEPSNSLIVTATQQLILEVVKLAESIDSRAAQTVEIATPVNGVVFESVLQQFLGQSPTIRRSPATSGSSSQLDRFSGSSSRDRNK